MPIHIQTTIFMICIAYLVVHGVIWFALSEQRNLQVWLWCSSGLLSGVSIVFLSMRDLFGEFLFLYVGQLLMLGGNMGRCIALRLFLPESVRPAVVAHTVAALGYYLWIAFAYEAGTPDGPLSVMFFGFYAIVCFDYFLAGSRIHQHLQTLGPRLLMIGGLAFCSSLGFKAILVAAGLGADGIYAPGIDQYVMIAGQFIAITLVNIGFLRIFLDLREQKNLETERNLAAAEAQAGLLTRHREELQLLLTEREEIIRQLTLSNKTAGMGALVASLAHELNQPLCAIRLNAQLVERKLNDPEVDVQGARKFLDSVIADNRRAANIITKLRNMFEHSNKEHGLIHLDELVRDTLALVEPRALHENVTIHSRLESELSLQGDSTQLQQVILNLLNNALDALMLIQIDHKTIGVRTENIGGRLVLHVTDNGVGIPEDLKPSVFELFKTNKAQGMGVGLWLSRTVINAHRGDIRFQSREGEGTHFEVELPVG